MLASLPMYDLPAVRGATDAWWQGLAGHMRRAGIDDVPAGLSRNPQPSWTDSRLLFSQTCGYPFAQRLAGRVELVCTPAYDAPGCEGVRYASALVVAEESPARALADLRGGIAAFNSRQSHSGYNVLRYMVAPLATTGPFFRDARETGTHAASIGAIRAGEADLCAVDTVTHALLARHDPDQLAGTRVLAYSPTAPGLPCIAGPAVSGDTCMRLREAIQAAMVDCDLEEIRAALLIAGAATLPPAAYDETLAMERAALAQGRETLC